MHIIKAAVFLATVSLLVACSTGEPTANPVTVTVTPGAATETVAPAPEPPPVTTEAPVPDGSREKPVPLNASAQVGEFDVSVTQFVPNANDMIAKNDEYGDPPTGQYVVVGLKATYNGPTEGNPGFDLTATMVGSDARQYNDYDSWCHPPNAMSDTPTVENGGTAEYNVCFDMPPESIEGARFFVSGMDEETFEETRVYFTLP